MAAEEAAQQEAEPEDQECVGCEEAFEASHLNEAGLCDSCAAQEEEDDD